MLTALRIRNFKRFDDVEIELGNPVVFVGPNNSGKTSAMQALALWEIGLRRWNEKRLGARVPEKRPGVTINRRDLLAIPNPRARLLWRDLRVRAVEKAEGHQRTTNVRIEVIVEGIREGKTWICGLEFDYANEESFYCRPLRQGDGRMTIPAEAGSTRVVILHPMSGFASRELRLDPGAVYMRVGEGRTAEVLRNLCYRIYEKRPAKWKILLGQIDRLFGAELKPPRYVAERGEITMAYRECHSTLDLSSSGRGLQQTLLVLAYLYANPNSVIMLDEPGAHLEVLRQREIYRIIADVAEQNGSQIIAASHSAALLDEAAKDMVISFVRAPRRMGGSAFQLRKSLEKIGFDQYIQAEQTGWVLYLEGSTDLAILQAFASRLENSDAMRALQRPFVHYVGNQAPKAADHFYGLKEALPELRGIVLLDRQSRETKKEGDLELIAWERREIENYLCTPATLEAYARSPTAHGERAPLFIEAESERRLKAMREAMDETASAFEKLDMPSPWDPSVKVSDLFLKPLFKTYFKKLGLPNLMDKKSFYELARYVPEEDISKEVTQKLDAIVLCADGPGNQGHS